MSHKTKTHIDRVLDILLVTGSLALLDTKPISLWSECVMVALPHDHPLSA